MEENKNIKGLDENNELQTFEADGKKYGGTSFNDDGSVKLPEGESILKVDYNVRLEEEDKAFREFQKMYVRRSNIIKTVVLAMVMLVFGYQFLKNHNDYISGAAIFIAAAAIFIVWYNPVMIRKNLMKALAPLEKDRYIFKLYDDAFTIETVIDESEFEEGEERIAPPPRVVWLEGSAFEIKELDEIFVVIMKKETIYVLPKRCMNDDQAGVIRERLEKFFVK